MDIALLNMRVEWVTVVVVNMLNFNSMMYHFIRKTILGENGLSTYYAK